jgi:hypothetical protein
MLAYPPAPPPPPPAAAINGAGLTASWFVPEPLWPPAKPVPVTTVPAHPVPLLLPASPLPATTNVENDEFGREDVLEFEFWTVTVYEVPGVTVMLFT